MNQTAVREALRQLSRTHARLVANFDPGGNLPADCDRWVVPHFQDLARLHLHLRTLERAIYGRPKKASKRKA